MNTQQAAAIVRRYGFGLTVSDAQYAEAVAVLKTVEPPPLVYVTIDDDGAYLERVADDSDMRQDADEWADYLAGRK